MKTLFKKVLNSIGYDLTRHRKSVFTIEGVTYHADPCSVGETPQGELTARGAIRMIEERGLVDLRIFDICCGVGIVGLTTFARLRDSAVREAAFVDINIFNLNSLHKTLAANGMQAMVGSRLLIWLSDGLANLPRDQRFDLIISNPPHYPGQAFSEDPVSLSPVRLGTYDPDWRFHDLFYARSHEHLTDRGEVWFLENGAVAEESDFLPFIEANPNLEHVSTFAEPLDPSLFWMITRRVAPAA